MFARCVSTVRTLRTSFSAISGVDVAEREQPEDLDLARGQLVGRPLRLVRLGGEPGAQLRVDVGPAGNHRVDRGDELAGG